MNALITANSKAGEKSPDVPFKDDGSFYDYMMYFDDNSKIAYADELDDLIELIIPEYKQLDEEQKFDARISFSLHLQSVTQQLIVNSLDAEELSELKDWELAVLSGQYNETDSYTIRGFWKEQLPEGIDPDTVPEGDQVDVWGHEYPLVLLDVSYEPWTQTPPPLANPEGDNIIWLKPSDEVGFLDSLTDLGLIVFGDRKQNS